MHLETARLRLREMTVDDLLERFARGAGHLLDNDRILLSDRE